MARIPDEELERLKREVLIVDLARRGGVELERKGEQWICRCPAHDESEASCFVHPEKNVFKCFGCGAGGSVIDWVMATEGVSFRHAAERLREEAGAVSGLRLEAAADDSALLGGVADFYQETMKATPEALAYLDSRGLLADGIIEVFRLGLANRTLGYQLPSSGPIAGKAVRGRLQDLGVLRKSGHEHLSGSLIVPFFDRDGGVCQLYGRKIRNDLRKGTPKHLYLGRPLRGLLNPAGFSDGELILCEAPLDALTFWAAGFRNVTSTFGTQGFGADLLDALQAAGVERVLIAFDRDQAGDDAAASVAKKLGAVGISAWRVLFPKGMDANEYAQLSRPVTRSLKHLLDSAEHLAGPKTTAISIARVGVAARPSSQADATDDTVSATDCLAATTTPEPAPEPASPLAADPAPVKTDEELVSHKPKDVALTLEDKQVILDFGPRRYRIRGLDRNTTYDVMKVNVMASHGEVFHVDTLNLYSARPRAAFVKAAATELAVKPETVKRDLGRILMQLEELQDRQIKAALEPDRPVVEMTTEERAEAEAFLDDPLLLDRLIGDLDRCGLVGERINKLTAFLAAVSRKLFRPLAVLVQSSSAAGKSALMDAVLSLIPPEERVSYSAMTGQSLYYMGEKNLKHKVLAIAEEEGAERASYALKLLQSEGQLSIASTGKDPASGKLVTHEYHVEGPVAMMLTSTAIDIDEELLNRCIILTVNESREQTRAIHEAQRAQYTLEGIRRRSERTAILRRHNNAQRLLEPIEVLNPFSPQLHFPDHCTRTRRDHAKYLALIAAITLLHQRQRRTQTTLIEGARRELVVSEISDIARANELAAEVLGRSLDELPPQTRKLLLLIEELVAATCLERELERHELRFTRRQVIEASGMSLTQVRHHLQRLVDHEYVVVHSGRRGHSFVYELLYDGGGKDGNPFVIGLIDVDRLQGPSDYDEKMAGSGAEKTGPYRGQNGSKTAGWRNGEKSISAEQIGGISVPVAKKRILGDPDENGSYRFGVSP